MSVITRADEKLDQARENIDQAYRSILEVLNPDTWGHEAFADETINMFHEISGELLKMKQKL